MHKDESITLTEEGDNQMHKDESITLTEEGLQIGNPLGKVHRVFSVVLTVIGVLAAVTYLFNIGVGYWGEYVVGTGYLHLLLACFLPLVFIYYPATPRARKKGGVPWYDSIAATLCFICPFYFFLRSQAIVAEGWEVIPPAHAFYLGVLLWVVALEAARRTVGWIMFALIAVISIYPLFAGYMPGMLFARSFEFPRLVGYYMMGPEAIIGLPTRVLGQLFIGFLLFGIALGVSGGGKFFLDFALALFGTVRGGIAKTAIVASSLVGMVSGSAVTNVLIIGTTTIPAMIKGNYSKNYAAGIESCASTGGVIMPPIMGAAAFIMAGILDISYATVALAAIIPAILYYVGLFVQVDGYAVKHGLKGIPREELPKLSTALKEGVLYIIAFAILIYAIFIMRQEAQAPFYAAVVLLGIGQIRKGTRLNLQGFIKFIESAGKTLAEITAILSTIGLLIGAILITGIAQTLTTDLIALSGGHLIMMVVLGAIASFILGMGLPATACYLLLAVLLAPVLISMGLNTIAVHFFVFYCGALSFITPPVAIAAFAAASIAGTSPMKAGYTAMRLGAVLFIIPLIFVFDPSFVLQGSAFGIVKACITGLIGVILITSGLEGYLAFVGIEKWFGRILTIIAGLLIFIPVPTSQIIGGILAVLIFLGKRFLTLPMPVPIPATAGGIISQSPEGEFSSKSE